ncbi:MAG TPA: hypothetical protein DCS82_01075 [Rhodospirillaceae bacterium]|nr:hypothetical protein [Rhodospirillaceae bacterium]HAA93924.1 hypothetical protein [Rhodospirillaceae bacterium]HAT34281.1 hypothetical protein [Rhodospirillaceae bacterium]
MSFYKPDLGTNPEDPFARDGEDKLIRRTYWLDMTDQSVVLALTQGVGIALSNEEKRAHLVDIRRDHLIEQVCLQEVIPPQE